MAKTDGKLVSVKPAELRQMVAPAGVKSIITRQTVISRQTVITWLQEVMKPETL